MQKKASSREALSTYKRKKRKWASKATQTLKEIAKTLQNCIERKVKGEPQPYVQVNVQTPSLQKEVVTKEVVMIPCVHCNGLMPETSVFCPTCGAQRKR